MLNLQSCAAIITGASSGLGVEFARQLAHRAARLMLVARRLELLEKERLVLLQLNPRLRVEVCAADLGSARGCAAVIERLRALEFAPNLLINNAGLGDYGAFTAASEERLQAQVEVNMGALVRLTHGLLPVLQSPGGILNVGSLAATLPMPDLAVYAATKAFVLSFSEALAVELAGRGLVVTCLCPGPTPTSFGANARREDGADTNRSGQGLLRIPPQQVVSAGLRGLEHGQPVVFPGFGVAVAARVFRLMPRPLLRWFLRRRFAAD